MRARVRLNRSSGLWCYWKSEGRCCWNGPALHDADEYTDWPTWRQAWPWQADLRLLCSLIGWERTWWRLSPIVTGLAVYSVNCTIWWNVHANWWIEISWIERKLCLQTIYHNKTSLFWQVYFYQCMFWLLRKLIGLEFLPENVCHESSRWQWKCNCFIWLMLSILNHLLKRQHVLTYVSSIITQCIRCICV